MSSPKPRPKPRIPSLFERGELYLIVKVGTRGVCLLILGFVWTLLGTGFLLSPMERFSKPGPGGILDSLDNGPGVYIMSSMWLLGGLTALIVGVRRPITCRDDIGFNGVCLPPFIWGMAYWWSYFLNQLSDGELGKPNTYIAGIIYWAITILVVFISRHMGDHPAGPCIGRRGAYGQLLE